MNRRTFIKLTGTTTLLTSVPLLFAEKEKLQWKDYKKEAPPLNKRILMIGMNHTKDDSIKNVDVLVCRAKQVSGSTTVLIAEHKMFMTDVKVEMRNDKVYLPYSRESMKLVTQTEKMVDIKGNDNLGYLHLSVDTDAYSHWIEVEHMDYRKVPNLPYL